MLDSSGNKLIGDSGGGDSGSGPAGLNDRTTYTAPTLGTSGLAARADGGGAGVNTTALSTTVAPVLTTVASFNGSDGECPQSSLIADANGDLFGTTSDGGANGYGTVFEIVNNGTPSAPSYASTPITVASFNGSNGASSLIADANGDLFGTTYQGGANNDGAVFEIVNNGTVAAPSYASTPTTLASFYGGGTGSNPNGSLIADANGDLFGTTSVGGANNGGTVFEIAKTTTGYASAPPSSPASTAAARYDPRGSLIADANGDLFGTTEYGGATGYGRVFEIVNNGSLSAPSYASTPTILVSFNWNNGGNPYGGLIADADGDLFGTTYGGGTDVEGTVFEIAKTASGYAGAPTTLVTFNFLFFCRNSHRLGRKRTRDSILGKML